MFHHLLYLLNALHCQNGQVLHEHALLLVLLQLELGLRILPEQVADLLIVDLDVGATHEELLLQVRLVVNEAIDVREGVRYDALVLPVLQADHSMRLTAPCLPVGKYGAIIATYDRFDQWEASLIIDLSLCRLYAINCVISKYFLLRTSFFPRTHNNLHSWLVYVANALAAYQYKSSVIRQNSLPSE